MDNQNLTIVVNTCDNYKDVLKLFFAALNEYWPDLDFPVVINSEFINYTEYHAKTHIIDNISYTWGGRLISTLNSIDTEFVLMLYDDFILEDYVKKTDIRKAKDVLLRDSNASAVYLIDTHLPVKRIDHDNLFLEVQNNCDYRLNSAPALWRRKDLLSFVGFSDNPWAWEVFGSYRTITKNKLFYTLNKSFPDVFPYNYSKGGAVYRGKWVKDVVVNKIQKYNLDIDLNIRGFSDALLFEKRTILWKIKFLFIGIRMIGFRFYIPLYKYFKIKFLKWF